MTYENFPGMLGLLEGRDRATPIFGNNSIWVFFQNSVCME